MATYGQTRQFLGAFYLDVTGSVPQNNTLTPIPEFEVPSSEIWEAEFYGIASSTLAIINPPQTLGDGADAIYFQPNGFGTSSGDQYTLVKDIYVNFLGNERFVEVRPLIMPPSSNLSAFGNAGLGGTSPVNYRILAWVQKFKA
jgi:hypothetical protein